MKIVSETLQIENGISMLKSMEDLGLKYSDLVNLKSPVAILHLPGYYKHCEINFHKVIRAQVASLICLGYTGFKDYVTNFNEALVASGLVDCSALVELLEKNDDCRECSTIESISKVVSLISENRFEFSTFIDCLKINRPSVYTKEFNSVKDLENLGIEKFFISNLTLFDTNATSANILNCVEPTQLCAYDVANCKLDMEKFETISKSLLAKTEELDLEIAFKIMCSEMNPKTSRIAYSYLYEIVYELMIKWGI